LVLVDDAQVGGIPMRDPVTAAVHVLGVADGAEHQAIQIIRCFWNDWKRVAGRHRAGALPAAWDRTGFVAILAGDLRNQRAVLVARHGVGSGVAEDIAGNQDRRRAAHLRAVSREVNRMRLGLAVQIAFDASIISAPSHSFA
jgi:hypothetical protein